MSKIIIYVDGGARNNPGPAAIGIVIRISPKSLPNQNEYLSNTKRLEKDSFPFEMDSREKEYSKFIGTKTNNEAEYEAVIFALKKIKQLIGKEKTAKEKIEIRMDSELVVNQLNGQFKIKEKDLIPLFIEIWNLKQDFGEVAFIQIPREENKRADLLVNRELNSQNCLF